MTEERTQPVFSHLLLPSAPAFAHMSPALPPPSYPFVGEALMTEESINHVISQVRKHGSDCWWTSPVEELLPPSMKDQV